jgi:hypothetical protein
MRTKRLPQAKRGLRLVRLWSYCKDAQAQLGKEVPPTQSLNDFSFFDKRNGYKVPRFGLVEATSCAASLEL